MSDLEKEIEALIAAKKKKTLKSNKKPYKKDNLEAIKEIENQFDLQTTTIKLEEKISVNTESIQEEFDAKKKKDYITKKDIINQLRMAKAGHQKWMSNVQILTRIGNIHEVKSSIPVNFTACVFGKWYFGKGQMLASFVEYQNLDRPHQMIHDTYLQIFDLYKKRIEGSLFNSEAKQKKARTIKSDALVKILLSYSKALFENLFSLENIVKNLSEKQMDDLNII